MVLKIANPITEIEIISVEEHNVERINSIPNLYKKERQESKPITFALTR